MRVTTLHLSGYLQEVHCPLSVCGLCIKCHCHWRELERHLSRWEGWPCMHTQNGQPQHPSRCTHVAQYETCTSTFTAMAADRRPLYATVVFSMTPVTVHKPSMEITHSPKPSVLSGGHGDIYQAANIRQESSDALRPLGCMLLAFCFLQWEHLFCSSRASN